MCDVCADFLHLLVSYEKRLSSNETKQPSLHKSEIEIAFNYSQTWPQRQCMCCYREIKNFERFNLIIQSLLCLTVCQLNNIKTILANDLTLKANNNNNSNSNNGGGNGPTSTAAVAHQAGAAAPAAIAVADSTKYPPPPIGAVQQSPTIPSDSNCGSGDAVDSSTKKQPSDESIGDDDDQRTMVTKKTPGTPSSPPPLPPSSPPPQQSQSQTQTPLDETWSLQELEKVLILISKGFLLNFPLYVAYKHGIHSRLDEITAQEAQILGVFCDLHDNEIPAFLLRNVTLFCNTGGFAAMTHCIEQSNLPVSTAHAITAAVSNLKLWLNYRSIVQLFVPLRIKVLQYMCKLSDQDLRSPATRSMADFMWAAIKDPLDTQVTFDTEGLALAFKYFTSTTLTMRLAGIAQINAHINLFNDICTSETVAEVEIVGQKLADWLTENQIISHLFGPNLHVEVIKQSHVILNFLAVEMQISDEHINLIWQGAQLKHCSKPIYDILPSLVKNLAPRPAMHLYNLLCRLDPKEHTEQSIYIVSALTKLIWSRDGTKNAAIEMINTQNMMRDNAASCGVVSSSENSVSIDGSNSDEEQQDDDSSDERKSHIEVDGSDSGAPPCKKPHHKPCCDETTDESIKIEGDIIDDIDLVKMKEQNSNLTMLSRRINSIHAEPSSSEEENEITGTYLRKKMWKRRKMRCMKKQIQEHIELVASISDVESHSDGGVGSDCSDNNLQSPILEHLHAGGFVNTISENHLIDLLSGAENDGSYSSPMSNKSEKNMADFDDEDSPCEEEMAQLAARSQCLTGFSLPRPRTIGLREGVPATLAVKGTKVIASKPVDTAKEGHSSFKAGDVCQPGNTLLWDLLQDDKIGQLGESLALEAEKALGTLLCFNTDKYIRTKFIEGCLQNIAQNKSVIVSLRLLPKLFASFQQFRAADTHQVTMWAERQNKMMYNFFNNLKHYAELSKNQNPLCHVLGQNGEPMYSHLTQVQVRLQFLTSVYSTISSSDTFRLSLDQVDILWAWLANDSECADCLFAWLQGQAKGGDQHALGIDTLQHLYLKKLPELRPEGITMVALGLFQQLCSLARIAAAHYEKAADSSLDIVGMSHLWKIALRANNTDVSLAAIQYINSFYMGQQLKLEKEFVAQCMNHLTQAAEDLESFDNQENALMCVQRALMLLNTHLETFRRRYAYHLRRWALEGKAIGFQSALRQEGPGPPIRVVLQPGGLPDKSVLHLHATDLVADLKAEIAKWWEALQGGAKSSGASAPVLGLLLSEGPLRIITQGQEITADYDERSLADVGFKDNQMVYVSLGGRGGRRRDPADHPSLQPPPPKECLPTVLLLQPQYFEQLFRLMQLLGDMKTIGKGGNMQPHTKAQLLSRRVWDILAMLPTNPNLLDSFKSLADHYNRPKVLNTKDENTIKPQPTPELKKANTAVIQDHLDPQNLQKFMYSLHIVESLCKLKYPNNGQCCDTMGEMLTIKNETLTRESADDESAKILHEVTESGEHKPLNEDSSEQKKVSKDERTILWSEIFLEAGGLRHLFDIFMSGVLQSSEHSHACSEWRNDCLASLLRILCLLGVEELKPADTILTVPKLNQAMIQLMIPKQTLRRFSSILNDASRPANPHQFKTGFWGRAQVVHFTINLLVCFVHSSSIARKLLWVEPDMYGWLQRIILDDPDPAVRREACAGLYRICLGSSKAYHDITAPLLSKLVSFLGSAEKMTNQNQNLNLSSSDDGKEPYGPACRDYFWLLCRLVDTLTPDMIKDSYDDLQSNAIDIEALCRQVSRAIIERDFLETRHGNQDDGLVGLINLMANLIKYETPFKFSPDGQHFIGLIFECLFELPSPHARHKPKCKSHSARAASYDLLVEMCKNTPKNYALLHGRLLEQHRPGPHPPYPWDYWPRDDGRSECGYVGLTNLGATCYMASCIQHLFMMPQAREAILTVPQQAALKHPTTLHELQRMFAYLMESERKSYNPRSFCRVYQMDHQPLNTGEQKDMAEFFIDLVSKLEEMTGDLKSLVKQLFCGVLSNNVVSLNCGHVSRTLEEFYTVRCQVADMRNLHESLDEVTVKDTLEGDNMYTCSQCGRKVRAEKRACFKKLPQILCFNTMRYTFNMVTMLKEKVNTHFSFPMRLDMSGYVEKTLMPQHYQEEKERCARQRREAGGAGSRTSSESETPMSTSSLSSSTATADASMEDVNNKKSCERDEDDNEKSDDDLQEYYEYDLVGVTVHTGTADGGHYYSFIKERGLAGAQQDRWFLFNDAEVKIFDPSQIATECFGGEMTSKTYDSVTEKYLDFSFEKTNSAYMLFYERRTDKDSDREPCTSENNSDSQFSMPTPSCSNYQQQQQSSHSQKTQIKEQPLEAKSQQEHQEHHEHSAIKMDEEILINDKHRIQHEIDNKKSSSSSSSSGGSGGGGGCSSGGISLVKDNNQQQQHQQQQHQKPQNCHETEPNSDLQIKNNNLSKNNKCDIENKDINNTNASTPSSVNTQIMITTVTPATMTASTSSTLPATVATDSTTTSAITLANQNESNLLCSPASSTNIVAALLSPKAHTLCGATAKKSSTLLSKELEDWIWEDNRHFLQEKNIFEHTYFNFMWQICGHIPQTLLMQTDMTCIAAQLSVSFFIESFIHAKEKPTMVLWVELLTKQFNSSQEACEWFLTHMSTEPWWPVQVLIQCPNQMVRQMFQRLVIHVIQRLRSSHCSMYLKSENDDEEKEVVGNASCVTKFIKSLILLMEHGAKAHLRHLSEFFGLLYEFSRMGEEETLFLLRVNVIRSVAEFYLGHKSQDCIDTTSDNDENSSDETHSVEKARPASLDKMIALVASLVERSRGPDLRLHLSTKDYNAIAGGKGFPFLYQQIKDNINPHQTRHLIHALCRWDERLANQIISMLFTAVTKHTELCGPFFKLLTLLTESSGGPSGLPCFSQLVLQRVWDAAEYCPQSALDWLAVQVPRNKIAHAWILQSAESWVEQFLIAHNNTRVRNAAAYLLISLVPSQSFRTNYRGTSHNKTGLQNPQRELSSDAQIILHTIFNLLLRLLRSARSYTDIAVHGTTKLTAYFTLMTYCMVSKPEKLMLGPHLRALWDLFHPRLSEPSVPAHHNKQALLAFWHHATNDCPENAQIVANCAEITRNIAFNYILADHDDSEIVAYNRAMLPAYYGLLRLCCQQSRTLTRQLAAHQNLQWAFKNITPHPTQYAMAVDELFRLMTLFAARHADFSDAEVREVSTFRRTTLTAYLSGLDARVSWGTLIAALRILVDNDEDRLFVVYNGGIAMSFEALHTLHSMYHEATACHVSGDLQELLTELVLLVSTLRLIGRSDQKKRPAPGALKGLPEAVRRLATLLNTFNPPEIRNLSLEVLKELVKNATLDVITVLVPLLSLCHIAVQSTPHSIGPLGPFFPRRGNKANWPSISKNTPRPPRPMVQMCVPQSQMIQRGIDSDFDAGLDAFYKPYHDFLDVMFRMAVNVNQLNDTLVNFSLLVGIEAASLHFNFFPKFWVGIHNNKTTNRYVELLTNNPSLVDYVDVILRDERISLNDPIILSFVEIYFPKVKSRLAISRLIESIIQILPEKDNPQEICGDLNAVRVIAQTTDLSASVRDSIRLALEAVSNRFKTEFSQDDEPPQKKRRSNPIADSTESPTMASQPSPAASIEADEKATGSQQEETESAASAAEADADGDADVDADGVVNPNTAATNSNTTTTISIGSTADQQSVNDDADDNDDDDNCGAAVDGDEDNDDDDDDDDDYDEAASTIANKSALIVSESLKKLKEAAKDEEMQVDSVGGNSATAAVGAGTGVGAAAAAVPMQAAASSETNHKLFKEIETTVEQVFVILGCDNQQKITVDVDIDQPPSSSSASSSSSSSHTAHV